MTDIVGDLTQVIGTLPTTQDIVKNVLLGAGTTLIVNGLKSADFQNQADPLHLVFHAPAQTATPTTPAQARPSATNAAFASWPLATQQAFWAAGGIVAG